MVRSGGVWYSVVLDRDEVKWRKRVKMEGGKIERMGSEIDFGIAISRAGNEVGISINYALCPPNAEKTSQEARGRPGKIRELEERDHEEGKRGRRGKVLTL